MAKRDPFSLPKLRKSLPTLAATLKHSMKKPYIGVTQGGSSRKDNGAKVAATDGKFRPIKPKKRNRRT